MRSKPACKTGGSGGRESDRPDCRFQRINQSKLKKDILSRGPDELVMIADDALANADTAVTARVLAAASGSSRRVDLVLCGEGSADLYFQQVGLQLGELLDLPTLNAVSSIA
jgi:electron transfer flavoprotein beta subunit